MEINKRDYQISLCIPTNGVSEWAFPVLDSIYNQGVSEELFEVIVTDNGKNMIFREEMLQYAENKKNMIYRVTDAPLFLNEIEAYKSAGGKFIKFINHRTILLAGALKQLISFARTLLSNPSILVLDEATSSIDVQTERALQKGLNAMLQGRTSFIIAHRLSTIKNCDKIMYIDQGGIMECGTHEELMEKKGYYYHLYTAQMEDIA